MDIKEMNDREVKGIKSIEDPEEYICSLIQGSLKRDEINVKLQPIVRSIDEKLTGAEALCRWEIPGKGVIYPDVFIPVLRKCGLIHLLDCYVAEKAAAYIKRRTDMGKRTVPVSVNISLTSYGDLSPAEAIDEIVKRYGIDRRLIRLEITEEVTLSNLNEIKGHVNDLKRLGYEVWLDDYGKGTSQLQLVRDIKFDVVKMDKGFVTDLNERSGIILRSICSMMKDLEISPLAEGVETEEQTSFLKKCGYEYLQGYYFSRAVTMDEFDTLLDSPDRSGVTEKDERPDSLILKNDTGDKDGWMIRLSDLHEFARKTGVFDLIRLVSIEDHKYIPIYFNGYIPYGKLRYCYSICGNDSECKNCVSSMALASGKSSMKLEKINGDLCTVIAEPARLNGKEYALEMIKKLDEVHPDIGLSDKKLLDKVRAYNNRLYEDSLTGSKGRRFYDEILYRRKCQAIAYLDIDSFKEFNDHNGHMMGDRILKEAVRKVKKLLHEEKGEFMTRMGGDEFILTFREIGYQEFSERLTDIRRTLERIRKGSLRLKGLSVSIGGYYGSVRVKEGMNRSDMIMYEAKKQGKIIVMDEDTYRKKFRD